ncbi:MAG TPA: LAGLIDADG family homing endonuclease [Candidatus Paceibacterota bacterium]|nr:LAGLIDADG family homing endonuclease [Candidatus Paceibacterota bacterium]
MEGNCRFCNRIFVKKYNKQKFCCLVCSNRYNLNNKTIVSLPNKYSSDLAEFFGILLGDGCVSKYFLKISLNSIADFKYIPLVTRLLKKLFRGASISLLKRRNQNMIEVQISSKEVCDYIRKIGFESKTRYIPNWILKNSNFFIATIRGLFDTEGSVGIKYFNGKSGKYFYKQLTVTNKNKNILVFLQKYLEVLKYHPTNNSNKNIYISNSNDINRYLNEVVPHNPKLTKRLKIKRIGEFIYKKKI